MIFGSIYVGKEILICHYLCLFTKYTFGYIFSRQKLHDLTDTMDSKASYPKMMGQGIAGRHPF